MPFEVMKKQTDEKIGEIHSLIKSTSEESKQLSLEQERKAIARESAHTQSLMLQMKQLFAEYSTTPVSAVENDSCQGGGK